MTQRKIQYWVIPPEAAAEFIAAMEDVLETYEQPYNADCPVLCMDEQPVQLHKEIRKPIASSERSSYCDPKQKPGPVRPTENNVESNGNSISKTPEQNSNLSTPKSKPDKALVS